MKLARWTLKLAACIMALAAVACCVIAYWDKITEGALWVRDKLAACREGCCQDDGCSCSDDDYADWDE